MEAQLYFQAWGRHSSYDRFIPVVLSQLISPLLASGR